MGRLTLFTGTFLPQSTKAGYKGRCSEGRTARVDTAILDLAIRPQFDCPAPMASFRARFRILGDVWNNEGTQHWAHMHR